MTDLRSFPHTLKPVTPACRDISLMTHRGLCQCFDSFCSLFTVITQQRDDALSVHFKIVKFTVFNFCVDITCKKCSISAEINSNLQDYQEGPPSFIPHPECHLL